MAHLAKIGYGILIVFSATLAWAEEMVVEKIQIAGLRKISRATVMSYLPIKTGETIDCEDTDPIIRELYQTKFFRDIKVACVDNTLKITLTENVVIGAIKVSGNKRVTTKQLNETFKQVGLLEGQSFDEALLYNLIQALKQQYVSLGFYNATINYRLETHGDKRVTIVIEVQEGKVATIKAIELVGNKAFSTKTLLKEFKLQPKGVFSFFTNSDLYTAEKLDADLERLRAYYSDRGYLNFAVVSSEVTGAPAKGQMVIKLKLHEGFPYKIKGFELAGDVIERRAALTKLITLKLGAIFSRREILEIQSAMIKFLGDCGYGMANVVLEPELDEINRQVVIKFTVFPGKRTYIRQISFSGNTKTHDEVLRREMRLQEGSVFSGAKLDESRRRLANLGYLDDIDYKISPTQDPNQVDVTYNVKEASAITASIQGGYSDAEGFIYGANIVDNNLFGSGKNASIRFDNTKATKTYGLGYYDPYFTVNHIGLGVNLYYSKTDTAKMRSRSAYAMSVVGGVSSFVFPLSDYDAITLGLGIEHIAIGAESQTVDKVKSFLQDYGAAFNQFKVIASWEHSNLDRAIFPTKGFAQELNLTGYGPLNSKSLRFFTVEHVTKWYQPLFKEFILRFGTDLGYGKGLGKPRDLPFFKRFFGGGIGSVRGYEAGDLGGGDLDGRDALGHANGGNVLAVANASVIIPNPVAHIVRPSIFVDIGNIYNDKFRVQDLRSSYGLQVEVRTPLAPLIFSLAAPLRNKKNDNLERFQFSISASL